VPSVSVIIPTLNEAKRLPALLAALQNQTRNPHQIIVCDGHSDDQTLQIAQNAGVTALQAPRGVSKQRNHGARAAMGELLVFLDADDLPAPDFLEKIARSYQRIPFAIACPWFVAVDSGISGRLCYFLFNLGFFLGQSTVRMGSGVCLICPRDKFLACGGFDETLHLGEDIHLIRKLCPRFGMHRHLLVRLGTSGRRFQHEGVGKLMLFYARITPFLLLGLWKPLQKMKYEAAPYEHSEEIEL
jgi:glycosyltransferase involved in cell wall biosynthesis